MGGAYLGVDVNRAARICAAGHGGEILLSQTTRDLVGDGVELRDLGAFALAGLPKPERIFRIVVPGLRSDFPRPRVEAAERRRLRQRLPKGRSRKPTFEEAAWQVRALLPGAAPVLQEPLAKLGTELFVAHRALVGADGFLARIDRKRLAARLAAQREVTLVSPRARQEAESLEAKIACVDRLLDRRQALAELTPELSRSVVDSSEQIASLRGRLTRATAELDDAVMRAARALDPTSFKLGRTRHRGVYRSGRKYVVPFLDNLGGERRREFETLTEAHNFKDGLRIAEKAQVVRQDYWDWIGPPREGP